MIHVYSEISCFPLLILHSHYVWHHSATPPLYPRPRKSGTEEVAAPAVAQGADLVHLGKPTPSGDIPARNNEAQNLASQGESQTYSDAYFCQIPLRSTNQQSPTRTPTFT